MEHISPPRVPQSPLQLPPSSKDLLSVTVTRISLEHSADRTMGVHSHLRLLSHNVLWKSWRHYTYERMNHFPIAVTKYLTSDTERRRGLMWLTVWGIRSTVTLLPGRNGTRRGLVKESQRQEAEREAGGREHLGRAHTLPVTPPPTGSWPHIQPGAHQWISPLARRSTCDLVIPLKPHLKTHETFRRTI